MLNMTYRPTHNSPIPKITLLNFAAHSSRLSKTFDKYDKVKETHAFSPTFKRNWTISPAKHWKHKKIYEIHRKEKTFSLTENSETVDNYIAKVIKEFNLADFSAKERENFRERSRKNAFDKFFGENGEEEERKLAHYLRNCDLYEDSP
jgi:hypothetical protein